MDFDTLYKQLNPQQRKAVDTLAGPVMVLAGPGTGKTQLLAVRVANILKKTDVYPSNILVLTYTNAGVQAMRERLASLMGSDGYDVVVETYHSFANDLISESELAISVKGDRVDMTDLERIKILEHLIDHLEGIRILRPGGAPYLYRQDIQTNISNLKRDGITPERFENFLVSYRPDGVVIDGKKLEKLKALAIVYRAYEEAKMPGAKLTVFDERGRYDFDDMILLATEALRSEPDLLAQYREQFQFAMVDEFQDSNGSQLELLSTIFGGERPNLCVVGDDDQSIYRFQGASAGNFHLIERLFPEVEKIVLDQNYRSKKEILESSAKLIRQVPDGERVSDKELEATRGKGDKTTVQTFRLGTPEEEMTFLVEEIKKIGKSRWNDTAVLVRTRKQADQLIESFLQAGIPYATDGKEDVRNEHRIQQLLKILRLAQNSMSYEEKDLLLFEIMLFDFWEIEHRDVMSLVNFVSERKSHKDKKKRRQGKKDKEFLKEETQHTMEFENEVCDEEQKDVSGYDKRPSLLRELMLRFPEPERDHFTEDQWPTEEESNNLSICEEIGLVDPNKLHRAAWTIKRVMDKATSYPVYSLMMKFLQDSEMVEYVLKVYEKHEVVKMRELRAITSLVENLKKATHVRPGIQLAEYMVDLEQLERHDIPFQGEMVSSTQDGVKILTAHGSKGLEFETVFIPFCLQDKSWPKREMVNKIPLPHELLVGQEKSETRDEEKRLHEYDENRLFYVAATRAKDRLIFTAAPIKKEVFSRFLSEADLVSDQETKIDEEKTLISLLKVSEQPDPVNATKDLLAGFTDHLSLNPTSLNTYLSCPRKFLYHNLLKVPQGKHLALIFGSAVHRALDKCYGRLKREGKLPPMEYFEERFLETIEWEGVEQNIRQGCLHKLEDAKRWYQNELDGNPVTPLEMERQCMKRMKNGLTFVGRFDKIDPDEKSGYVSVVDYKTGKPDEHVKAIDNTIDLAPKEWDDYLRQLVAYKMLYEAGYKKHTVTSGQLVFIDPVRTSVKKYDLVEGEFMTKKVSIDSQMVEAYEDLVNETWEKIKALEFDRLEEHDSKVCGFCPYEGVCWSKSGGLPVLDQEKRGIKHKEELIKPDVGNKIEEAEMTQNS